MKITALMVAVCLLLAGLPLPALAGDGGEEEGTRGTGKGDGTGTAWNEGGAAEGGGTSRAGPDLGIYHTYDNMTAELQALAAAYPGIVQLVSLGQTYENRTLWAVKLSDNVTLDEPEPNITVLGGIHARELISVEVPLALLRMLAENYSSNATVRWWVNRTQFWFMPMVNPDGHAYVETTGDWRKNRRPTTGGSIGVDINRNFGHLWGLEASPDPADENYCGPSPFSENETLAVQSLVTAHPPRVALSYQSFGSYILYPWGNDIDQSPVDARLPALALNMSIAMPAGRRYIPMMARTMYPATGDTDDYFYANLSILPFTVELSGLNRPPDADVPGICADNFPAAGSLFDFVTGKAPAPPPPPPPLNHSLALTGPAGFSGLPGAQLQLNYTLQNTGEANESVNMSVWANRTGWSLQTVEGTIPMEPGQSVMVGILVRIPDTAPGCQTVSVTLRALAAGGANATVLVEGTVEPWVHNISIRLTGPGVVSPGTIYAVQATLKNNGNIRESLSLSAGTRLGWNMSVLPHPYNLSVGETGNLSVLFSVPARTAGGEVVDFTFAAASGGDYRVTETHQLTVLEVHNASLAASPRNVSMFSDEKRVVVLKLVNNGNLWENGTLSLAGRLDGLKLDNQTVSAAPFDTTQVNLTVGEGAKTGNLTVRYFSDGELRAQTIIHLNITVNTTYVPDMVQVAVLGLVLVLILVIVMVFFIWELRRGEKETEQDREMARWERLASWKERERRQGGWR